MKDFEYSGMSYEWASREAERLAKENWYKNFDRLAALKDVMDRSLSVGFTYRENNGIAEDIVFQSHGNGVGSALIGSELTGWQRICRRFGS